MSAPREIYPQPARQHFWRCEHYPVAIENFFVQNTCEHGCHTAALRWHDHGVNQTRVEVRSC